MDRQEHLAWCKKRAIEYLDRGELTEAVTSMLSDLGKHEETKASAGGVLGMLGLQAAMSGNPDRVRRFIVGFN